MVTSPKYAGEPSAESLASGLATLGRYGDEYMVHAAEGETMIPAEVFEANPGLRDALFWQMQMMGIKDPNRFVVGNAMNSINPITGQPEFWFKKIFKKVKKVFKKALPVLAPLLGNMILPGLGGLIASGLVTKLSGGSWGDVLKGAAIGWATQGLTSGIGSSLSGGSFLSGVGKGLSDPFTAGANLFSGGAQNTFRQGILGGLMPGGGSGVYSTGLNSLGKAAHWSDYINPRYNPGAQLGSAMPGDRMPLNWRGDNTPTDWDLDYEDLSRSSYADSYGHTNQIVDGQIIPSPEQQANFQRLNEASYGMDELENVGVNNRAGLAQLRTYSPKGPTSLLAQGELPMRTRWDPATNEFVTAPEFEAYPLGGPVDETSLVGQRSIVPAEDYPLGEIVTLPDGSQKQIVMESGKFNKYTGATTGGRQAFGEYVPPGPFDPINPTGKIAEGIESLGVGAEKAAKIAPWVTTAAVVGGGAGLVSLFSEDEVPKEDEDPLRYRAYDAWRDMEDKNSDEAIALYREWWGQPFVKRSDFEARIGGPSTKPDWWFKPEGGAAQTAVPDVSRQQAVPDVSGQQAGLGSILPQRAQPIQLTANRGGEVMGAGTGTSDSIPARLSDGEFVMTANAVRNAGNGDRNLGAARMYDMMRRFEGRAA